MKGIIKKGILAACLINLSPSYGQFYRFFGEFSPKSNFFIDERFVYNLTESTVNEKATQYKSPQNELHISRDEKNFYTADEDGVIRKWDMDYTLVREYGKSVYSLNTLAVDEEKQLLYAGCGNGYVYTWDLEKALLLSTQKIHETGISSMVIYQNHILTSDFSGNIMKTSISSGQTILMYSNPKTGIFDIDFSDNGYLVFTAIKMKKGKPIISFSSLDTTTKKTISTVEASFFKGFGYPYDYSTLVSAGLRRHAEKNKYTLISPYQVHEIDAKGRIITHKNNIKLEESVPEFTEDEGFCHFSKNNLYMFHSGDVLSRETASEVFQFVLFETKESKIAGKYEDTLTTIIPKDIIDGVAQLKNQPIKGAEKIIPLIQHVFLFERQIITNLDTTLLVTSNEGTVIKVFDLKQNRLIANLQNESKVIRLIRHPYAELFASLHIDGTINLWDFSTQQLLKTYQCMDNKKYQKLIKQTENKENNSLYYCKGSGDDGRSPLVFTFDHLGEAILFFTNWEETADNFNSCVNFNYVNILTDKKSKVDENAFDILSENDFNINPFYRPHRSFYLLRVMNPVLIKGFHFEFQKEEVPDDFSSGVYKIEIPTTGYAREELYIDPILLAIAKEAKRNLMAVVPAYYTHQSGKEVIIDYGASAYNVNLSTLRTELIDRNEIWDMEMDTMICFDPIDWMEFLTEDYTWEVEGVQREYGDRFINQGSVYHHVMEECNFYAVLYENYQLLIRNKAKKTHGYIPSQSSMIHQVDFLGKSDLLLTNNISGEIILWNWRSQPIKNPLVTFIGSDSELFAITPDFYYTALTPKATNIVFRKGTLLFGFEQFDIKYNRPDIVLKQIGLADSKIVEAYHQAYLKRLKKMNFTEEMLKDDFHLPEIKIENLETIPTIIDIEELELNLNIKDTKYPIDRINIWINDVAIYGADGISIRDKNTQEYQISLKVNLARGDNKIQVSTLNQAGAESYKETFSVKCTAGKEKSNLYLIGIGVSEFEQSQYNLKFAAKDAQDIVQLFANSKIYGEVRSKILTNEEVTRENVANLREFLKSADRNDEVVLFFAGHGVLDAKLDYYLSSYNMDFTQPENQGIAYEELEKLLDGIAPLKKILLIDACHSGEIDKDDVALAVVGQIEQGDIQFRAIPNSVTPKLGIHNTSELTKSLFADLRKGTGATVISSAGGMEFAMESSQWQNGLFTYCLLYGLQSSEADLNSDGVVMLSELQKYVAKQVTVLSEGKQQPTSRIENNVLDWRVR